MARPPAKKARVKRKAESPRPDGARLPEEQTMALRHFVEEMGLSMEYAGMPRMAGRILGYLLICDPPEQTAEEIARSVDASRASVSTMTRLLLNARLIERQVLPGRRRDVYGIHPEAFHRQIADRIRVIAQVRSVLERGLVALEGVPAARKERVRSLHRMYVAIEQELPRFLERLMKETSKK